MGLGCWGWTGVCVCGVREIGVRGVRIGKWLTD